MKKRLLVMLLSFSLGISSISGIVVDAAKTKTDKKTESTKKDNSKKDTSKKDNSKKDNSKKDNSKKDTSKKDDDKKDTNKKNSDSDDTKNSVGVANDGKLKSSGKECFVDSGYTSSFKDIKYYDATLPYKEKIKTIGGQYKHMSKTYLDYNIGRSTMIEFYTLARYADASKRINMHTTYVRCFQGKYEKDTITKEGWQTITDKNGITYLLTAVQPYFFSCAVTKTYSADGSTTLDNGNYIKKYKGFPAEHGSSDPVGQLIDVILTDGTCIHFVCCDVNADGDTNGGGLSSWDGYRDYTELHYKWYKNLFSAVNANCIEMLATEAGTKAFRRNFGLESKSGGKGSVGIAYYRMYNKHLGDKIEVTSEDAKKVVHNLGKQSVGTVNKTNVKNNATVVSTKLAYQETDLSAYATLKETDIQGKYLSGANKGTLGQSDISSLKEWEDNINDSTILSGVLRFLRVLTQIIGILFLMWILLIYVGYWFDRLNNFVDLDAVGILTLNKLHTSDTEEECTFSLKSAMKEKKMTVNHKAILGICLTGGVFGVLVVSGQVYVILGYFVNGMLALFGQG